MDVARVTRYIEQADFKTLFLEELGWDAHTLCLNVVLYTQGQGKPGRPTKHTVVDITRLQEVYELDAVAHKRGVVVFCCRHQNGFIPAYQLRRTIEAEVNKQIREHILIFPDGGKTTQVWQWIKREQGKNPKCRERTLRIDEPFEDFVRHLAPLEFTLFQEDALTLVQVAEKVQKAFDVDLPRQRSSIYGSINCEGLNFEQVVRKLALHALLSNASAWYLPREIKTLRPGNRERILTPTAFGVWLWECSICGKEFLTSERDDVAFIANGMDSDTVVLCCPWCEGPAFCVQDHYARTEGWWDEHSFSPWHQDDPEIDVHFTFGCEADPYQCSLCSCEIAVEQGYCDVCADAAFRGVIPSNEYDFVIRTWHCPECTRFMFTPITEPNIPPFATCLSCTGLSCPWCGEETEYYYPDRMNSVYFLG